MSAVLAPARRRSHNVRTPGSPARQDSLFGAESAPRRVDSLPTLDDVISHGWEGLSAGVAMACPICHGELVPDAGGGRCDRCGCTLG